LGQERWKKGALDYKRARICAAASQALRRDPGSPDAERQAAALEDRALETLRRALAAGFFDSDFRVNELKTDPTFAPLHGRADFQELVRGVARKSDPAKWP
jgi:hypothetical protein